MQLAWISHASAAARIKHDRASNIKSYKHQNLIEQLIQLNCNSSVVIGQWMAPRIVSATVCFNYMYYNVMIWVNTHVFWGYVWRC